MTFSYSVVPACAQLYCNMTHSRRSAALRASLLSSLPTSRPGNGGAEELAWRVASAAAMPVNGIPAASSGGDWLATPQPVPMDAAERKVAVWHFCMKCKFRGTCGGVSLSSVVSVSHLITVGQRGIQDNSTDITLLPTAVMQKSSDSNTTIFSVCFECYHRVPRA